MKSIFTLILALVAINLSVFAQEIKSSKSLQTALDQSSKFNKPVLLIINTPNLPKLANLPENAKVSFKSALDEQEVIEKIEETFIVYKTNMMDTSVRSIIRLSNIKRFPAYVFLRSNNEVFFSDYGNSSDKKKYLVMISNAMKAYKDKSISDLTKDVQTDKNNITSLKNLIDARKKIGITNNADLIEQYTNDLRIGDFNNYETVLYILEAGPYADGTAYKLAYTNRKLIDSIYKTEPLQRRVAINNAIISNTMIDAAKTKNSNRAFAGANYSRSTWSRDYRGADKSYNDQLLWYYNAVKDTAAYLRTASIFYDNHYMNVSADSIKKIEERNHQAMMKTPFPNFESKKIISKEKMDSLMKLPGYRKVTQSIVAVTSSSSSSSYANELNNAAWKFYEIGTKNINYLSKAMIWSRRAIELNPISGYYDTLAHILYRLGYFEEAIKTQQLAIEKAKNEKVNTTNFEIQLKKIKSKSL